MSQPKTKKGLTQVKHEQSNSLSSTTLEPKQYFHRSSMNKVHNINGNISSSSSSSSGGKKSSKMGSLKKWFSRFGDKNNPNTTTEEAAHRDIEKQIAIGRKLEASTMSMLLLGAGGSGKSTVLKQMDRIHNKDKYENEEKLLHETINEVHKNITLDIYDLCKQYYLIKQKDVGDINIKFESSDIENLAIKIATEHDPIHNNKLTKEFANDIEILWNTDTMKKVYEIRKKSHIMDNTPYFLDKVQQYANPNYIVTFDDYVRIRDQTTGIIHTEFTVDNGARQWLFKIIDVGGQRAERRKWLHVFSGIDVVIYVMSLSAYDQVLYEDHNTRCWDETLNLFHKTAANKSFKTTDFIVFLNKNDIFLQKMAKKISFRSYKSDFPENDALDSDKVINWIRQQFMNRFYNPQNMDNNINNNNNNGYTINYNKNNDNDKNKTEEEQKYNDHMIPMDKQQNNGGTKGNKKRGLHFHVTCATDTAQIETVVRYVQIELIRKLMSRAALL